MPIIKAGLILFAAVMVAFILAGILLANLRFFIFIGIVGLIVYVIYSMVRTRSSE
jgi:hypothetical protein